MRYSSLLLRAASIAALAAATLAAPVSSAQAYQAEPPGDLPPVRVTREDVNASNGKAAMAYRALVDLWTKEFAGIGRTFVAPGLARYRGGVRTACGIIGPSNAAYCLGSNTIYFDDVFVASQAKIAGLALDTDGDMAGVGIIAHEMGHAVAMQLGFRTRDSYRNEAVADCLAGVFARQSQVDGSLEDGDIDEAFFGMASAGDPTPEPTGDRRVDLIMAARVARGAHGTREQRMQNFHRGLEQGPAVCLPQLRGAA